ncbi:MAG: hypothetical protein JSV52_11995 [Candidatus Zixiibacteriota bacterium]|nr:MAG: hypothetical protein JSV52_11995 [candidate division Zixibacteria bacterium]
MKPEIEKAISQHPEVERYLKETPRQLWQLLLPEKTADFAGFAASIKSLRIREKERDYIIELRRKYGLPFRPNASIDETIKRVRLIRWKRKKMMEEQGLDNGAENHSADKIDPDEELI